MKLATNQVYFMNYAIMGAGISEWSSLINTTDLKAHPGLSKISPCVLKIK